MYISVHKCTIHDLLEYLEVLDYPLHVQQLILSHLLTVAINRIDYRTVKCAVNFASYPVFWVLYIFEEANLRSSRCQLKVLCIPDRHSVGT